MPLLAMEHFLVLSDDIDATRDFYRDALGFRVGFRPRLAFGGHWLYLDETPVIHIADRASYERYLAGLEIPMPKVAPTTGPIDHVAFNCSDFEGMRRHLEAKNIPFKRDTLTDIGLEQIFVHDPNGIKIELNFRPTS